MCSKRIVIFDTSVINQFALGKDQQSAAAVMAGVKCGYRIRLTATNVDEFIATHDKGKRERLRNVCAGLLPTGDCIWPYDWIIKRLVLEFEKCGPFDWRGVGVRAAEYEQVIRGQRDFEEKLVLQQRTEARDNESKFRNLATRLRPEAERLFEAGKDRRPVSFSDLYSRFQKEGGVFEHIGVRLYASLAKGSSDVKTMQRFLELCPPFHSLVLACCIPAYQAFRDLKRGESFGAGRNDLFMSAYLPYCDEFISHDEPQLTCLKEIVNLAKLPTKVRSYNDFCEEFLLKAGQPR